LEEARGYIRPGERVREHDNRAMQVDHCRDVIPPCAIQQVDVRLTPPIGELDEIQSLTTSQLLQFSRHDRTVRQPADFFGIDHQVLIETWDTNNSHFLLPVFVPLWTDGMGHHDDIMSASRQAMCFRIRLGPDSAVSSLRRILLGDESDFHGMMSQLRVL
jgi:hypothetical protein